MTMFLHVVCCSFGARCTEPRYKDARFSLGFKISCIFFAPPNLFPRSPPPTFRQPTVQHFESPPIMSFAETFLAHLKPAMIYVATTVSHFEAEVLHIPASSYASSHKGMDHTYRLRRASIFWRPRSMLLLSSP
jgi:hypothetical protein